ncbi:mitochondrial small ribosomal subunit Rsm22-domain-containing protein [Cercophora newfieldiana]|uniref:Mitochondrial small ribosomal subunit Rsm22-domain-containing protein n=1 Tax=Cercophora newfieldiana TaxID=92897 RepID=A0AA39YRW1_9PEZI|nr:mitochondrial small ribosomal subunit Rsm22-domain-containing protein [Cercophora newfieldiana]
MISASKLQNRCPGCRAQLLSFYDALLAPRTQASPHSFLRSSPPATTALSTTRSPRPSPIRQFSTSSRLFQEPVDTSPVPTPRNKETELKAEDSETIVRQARQTFGQTLPEGYLSDEEYNLYVRLYGPPLRETQPEDVGIPYRGESGDVVGSTSRYSLLRETEHGDLEEVEHTIAIEAEVPREEISEGEPDLEALPPLTDAQVDYLNMTANNQREYDALVKLQRDFESASLQPLEQAEREDTSERTEVEQDEEIDTDEYEREPDTELSEWDEPTAPRMHPNTSIGKFGPETSTVFLPKVALVEPIAALLKRADISHVQEAAERIFGGKGLPHSPSTPPMKGTVLPQTGVQLAVDQHKMSEIEADVYLATVIPGVYASVMSTLVEVRKRLGADWIRGLLDRDGGKGPRVLDVGGGGAGLAAWQEILQAEWDVLREKGEVTAREPPGKKTVIVGSDHLRHRISRFLHNTTFLPRLPDYLHSVEGAERQLDSSGAAPRRKAFDIIIASHQLMGMEKDYRREAWLNNLWAMLEPQGGVLIVLEKGHPRGFEAVANVRMRLLDEFIVPPRPEDPQDEITASSEHKREKEPGMIIAPCTNHTTCPLYKAPGLSPGRKDLCHFGQRFIRPPFLQRILDAGHRNHEDIKFSYLAVRRGTHPSGAGTKAFLQGKEAADRAFAGYEDLAKRPPNPLSLPRNIRPPLKRHGHITFEMCTPAGAVERWVVPKSFSKQAYRDARKTQWGDLWALGAKTRTHSNVRLGRAGEDSTLKNPADGGVRSRLAMGGGKKKLKMVDVLVDPSRGVIGAQERRSRHQAPERRTKGGKNVKFSDLMEEADMMAEEEDGREDREFLQGR